MHKLIRSLLPVLIVVAGEAADAQTAGPAWAIDETQLVVDLKDAKWTPATYNGVPPGWMVWYVAGDPKGGAAINYGKCPAGYVFPSHWHSYPESAVVVSGTAQ